MSELHPDPVATKAQWFATTHWGVVLNAGQASPEAASALEQLCRTYWYPLYAFVRRKGPGPHDAQDLTQAFFARLLEKNYVAQADRERGRFRTYLLAALHTSSPTNGTRRGEARQRSGNDLVRRGLSGGTLPIGADRGNESLIETGGLFT